jgi:NNP family nitrate/nitrite transporter-like MFS transporter
MPAIFDYFEHHYHLTAHVAWRRAFFVPFALIVATAILLLLLTPDTPVGKWSERQEAIEANLRADRMASRIEPQSGVGEECDDIQPSLSLGKGEKEEKMDTAQDVEQTAGEVIDAEYTHEIVVKPSPMEMLKVCFSQQTFSLMTCYFCSFGSELSINSILGAYYLRNFPELGQTSAGRLAAMFGIFNIYGRPLGGIVSDLLYKYSNGNLWAKKLWIHTAGIVSGIFMLAIGVLDSKNRTTMIGLVAGLAASTLLSGSRLTSNYVLVFHGCWQRSQFLAGAARPPVCKWYRFWFGRCDGKLRRHCRRYYFPI